MKTIRTLLFTILLGSLLSGCGSATQPTVTPFPESMKGYELYSWKEGKQWKFSLLIGTNRDKTLEEIKSVDVVLPRVTPFPESMKGYELYSWKEGKQWKFSLLIGTNRDKTLEEIKSVDVVLP